MAFSRTGRNSLSATFVPSIRYVTGLLYRSLTVWICSIKGCVTLARFWVKPLKSRLGTLISMRSQSASCRNQILIQLRFADYRAPGNGFTNNPTSRFLPDIISRQETFRKDVCSHPQRAKTKPMYLPQHPFGCWGSSHPSTVTTGPIAGSLSAKDSAI